MNESVRIAVCDDIDRERQTVVQLLSEYMDQNNLYVPIDTFSSGEDLLDSDISRYSLVFMDIFLGGMNGMETAKTLMKKNFINCYFITCYPCIYKPRNIVFSGFFFLSCFIF